jgi:hypothetical protein
MLLVYQDVWQNARIFSLQSTKPESVPFYVEIIAEAGLERTHHPVPLSLPLHVACGARSAVPRTRLPRYPVVCFPRRSTTRALAGAGERPKLPRWKRLLSTARPGQPRA